MQCSQMDLSVLRATCTAVDLIVSLSPLSHSLFLYSSLRELKTLYHGIDILPFSPMHIKINTLQKCVTIKTKNIYPCPPKITPGTSALKKYW